MTNVLIDLPVPEASLARLRELPGTSVHLAPRRESKELPAQLLRDKQVLLCKMPPANFDDLVDLQFMQLGTVGYEHLRHLNLADRPLRVANARGIFDTAIAEWNLAMLVNLRRDVRAMIRNQESAVWDRSSRFQEEIRGTTVGLWGYGGIGRDTARLAKAFGMTVHVLTRSGVKPRHDTWHEPGSGDPEGKLPDRAFLAGQEHDFLSGLDFLVLALPHTQKTTGMVSEAQLRALPRTALLLNPARGPIVQEQALLRALSEGWIAGAALDTHFAYPLPAEHPLWKMPNVILTPHIAGADHSRLFPARIGALCVENVRRFVSGEPLLNLVSAEEWREA